LARTPLRELLECIISLQTSSVRTLNSSISKRNRLLISPIHPQSMGRKKKQRRKVTIDRPMAAEAATR